MYAILSYYAMPEANWPTWVWAAVAEYTNAKTPTGVNARII